MSIYGAMFSGVSGLAAQSQALGMISDNISNVNTIGYKGTVARFSTLVTEAASATHYSPGGVRSSPYQKIDRQGLLQGSASATDIAIVGNGFFVVNEDAIPGVGDDYMFTRAGNFTLDESGYMLSNGYYLQGWRLDTLGNLPANTSVLNSLETVNVSNLTGAARQTTNIELAVNLPGASSSFLHDQYSTTVTVYDKQGGTHDLTYTWTKTGTDVWDVVASFADTAQLATDDTATATLSSGVTTYYPSATLADTTNMTLATAAGNVTGTVGAFTVNAPGGAPPNSTTITVTIGADAFTATVPTVAGNDLTGASSLVFTGAGGRSFTLDLEGAGVYDLDVAGDRTTLQSNLNAAFASVTFDNNAVTGVPLGSITFNADGTLGALTPTAPYGTASGGQFEFYVDYDADATTTSTADRQLITLDLGTIGFGDGMTQYGGPYYPSIIEQDGLSFGAFTGITIDENGIVTALFDNGQQRDIFKLPIATFRNPNGLDAVNGNAYLQTGNSGDPLLLEASTGGAGEVAPNSLESSTVDLAEEFTNMIITQRAYSASAKIITTADEMLEELIRIR